MTRLLRLLAFAIAIAGRSIPRSPCRARRGRASPSSPWTLRRATAPRSARASPVIFQRATRSCPLITSDAAAAVVDRRSLSRARSFRESRLGSTLAGGLLVATVSTRPASTDGERIVRIDAPREVPAATVIHIDADIESRGMTGQTTDATATIGGLEVGRVSHTWTAGATVGARASTPCQSAIRRTVVRIQAGSVADVVVDLRREPIRVEFYDPRPSWATTFVRRALEADARFQVAVAQLDVARLSTQTGDAVAVTIRVSTPSTP